MYETDLDKSKSIKAHYEEQGIDTFTRAKANMAPDEIVSVCRFTIDKYCWRKKGQDLADISKMRDYLDLWEEQLIGVKNEKANN